DRKESVTVGWRMCDRFGPDIAASARSIFDDELLAKSLREVLAYQARNDIGSAAGCKRHDDAHRPRRIGLRPCNVRRERQRGSARGQAQELSAGKFHDAHPGTVECTHLPASPARDQRAGRWFSCALARYRQMRVSTVTIIRRCACVAIGRAAI